MKVVTHKNGFNAQYSREDKNNQNVKRIFVSTLLLFFAFTLSLYSQTSIELKPNTINSIEGYSEVQDLFAVMTGKMNSKIKPYLRDAKITGTRNIINWRPSAGNDNGPGEYGYYFPSWTDVKKPDARCFSTKQESYDWFDNFIKKDPQPIWEDLLRGLDYMDSDVYGPVNVALSGNPRLFDGRFERDIPNSIKHVNAWIQTIKDGKPAGSEATLKYFQLSNEPEQTANWSGQFSDKVEGSQSYVRVFNAIYDEVKAAHPDVIIVPNCVGHESAFRLEGISKPGREDFKWDVWVGYHIDNINSLEALEYFNT